MERLVDDLLRVAKQGEVVTNPEAIDLQRVIETAWEGAGNPTGQAALHYEEVPAIGGDYDRLCELFENLFRNAVEHGGNDVTVTLGDLDDGFYIEDDGPGIPPEDRLDVFDARYSTRPNGNGFGLSIVKQVADAHTWSIGVTEGTAGGVRFEVTGVDLPEEGVSPLHVQ